MQLPVIRKVRTKRLGHMTRKERNKIKVRLKKKKSNLTKLAIFHFSERT